MWAGTGRVVRMSMYPLAEKEILGNLNNSQASFLERLATSGIDDLTLPKDIPDIASMTLEISCDKLNLLWLGRTRDPWID